MARALMIQGTASHVGKSFLATALCRLLAARGYRVAPFKALNLTRNTALLPDGLEISQAQYLQALAAGTTPAPEMNPLILKPGDGGVAELVVLGRPLGERGSLLRDPRHHARAVTVVERSLLRLQQGRDLLVLEGAGSPAEVNLMRRDLANAVPAELADAAVVLVADMLWGGAFAALVGTLQILPPRRRARVVGLVLNRLHGDPRALRSAVRWLERETGLPVLGVIPFLTNPGLPEEDGPPGPGPAGTSPPCPSPAEMFDRLANHVGRSLDLDALWRLLDLDPPARRESREEVTHGRPTA